MIPITQLRFSDIANELGTTSVMLMSDVFSGSKINKHGLNSTYCAGSTTDERLNNLKSKPYMIGKLRGYRHGAIYFVVSPNKIYLYDFESNVATELTNYYHLQSTDIAMTDNRMFIFDAYEPLYIREYFYDLRYPDVLNYSRRFNAGMSGASGLYAFSNDLLIVGGAEQYIQVIDITTDPVTFVHSIPIPDSKRVSDIVYLKTSDKLITVAEKILSGGQEEQYIQMYDFSTGILLKEVKHADITAYSLFFWRNKVYLSTIGGGIYEVNTTTLAKTHVKTKYLSGAIYGACSTPSLNDNI